MIFALAEEGTLFIKADLSEAQRDCNALDVESEVFRFFDEDGRSLEPVFIRPNRKRRILGLFSKWELGTYELRLASDPANDPIDIALAEASRLAPNPWFASIEAVREHFKKRRAERDTR